MLIVLTSVVPRTPVDTGRARSNWLVGINAPRRDAQPALDQSGQGAIAEGRALIAAVRAGTIGFVSNNLPYINSLNRGSSPQAPAGFVQHAVDDAAEAVRGVRFFD